MMLRWLGGPGQRHFRQSPIPAPYGPDGGGGGGDDARERVGSLLPDGGKVIFTSGATEALNMVLQGHAGPEVITFAYPNHAAVLDCARAVGGAGARFSPSCP